MGVTQTSLFQLSEHEIAEQIKKERIANLITMRDHYDQKAKKIRQKYWETGTGALKPAEDAEDIVDVIDMALRQAKDDGREYRKRLGNIKVMIGNLIKDTYTKEEVTKLLLETIDL